MINFNKKQIIIFLVIFIFMILVILVYFFKIYNSDYEVLESENILENTTDISENVNLKNEVSDTEETNEDIIVIHVTGAVHNPGIVKLPTGSRIADAINLAGGFTDDSDISSVNLAYKLDDGEKIYIPYISDNYSNNSYISSDAGQNIILEDSSSSLNGSSKNINLININSATQAELESIPGIGPSTALKIIQYRTENGKFNDINDIKNISRHWRCKI